MSLTIQLQKPDSPVRQFMQSEFPRLSQAGGRGAIGKEIALEYGFDQLMNHELVVPVPDDVAVKQSHSPLVGTAFDYRARMMLGGFAIRDSIAGIELRKLDDSAEISPAMTHYASILVGAYIMAVDKFKDDGFEEDLDTLAVILAWSENIYRAGPFAFSSSLGDRLRQVRSPEELIASIERPKLVDLANLRVAAKGQIEGWRSEIAGGERFESNPSFEGSRLIGADADWIIGDTLIDCKTTEKLTNSKVRDIVLQLVGYVLLDFEDERKIQSIAVWLPRLSTYHAWSIDQLITKSSNSSILELRGKFRAVLEKSHAEEIAQLRTRTAEREANED